MNNFTEQLKAFFSTGNNLYYVIAAAVVLVAIIVLAVVLAVRAKRKRAVTEDAENGKSDTVEPESVNFESEGIDVDKLVVDNETLNAAASETFILKPPEKYVSDDVDSIVMTPVKEEPRPPKKEVLPPRQRGAPSSEKRGIASSRTARERELVQGSYLFQGGGEAPRYHSDISR